MPDVRYHAVETWFAGAYIRHTGLQPKVKGKYGAENLYIHVYTSQDRPFNEIYYYLIRCATSISLHNTPDHFSSHKHLLLYKVGKDGGKKTSSSRSNNCVPSTTVWTPGYSASLTTTFLSAWGLCTTRWPQLSQGGIPVLNTRAHSFRVQLTWFNFVKYFSCTLYKGLFHILPR